MTLESYCALAGGNVSRAMGNAMNIMTRYALESCSKMAKAHEIQSLQSNILGLISEINLEVKIF
jgi:hypothetical protein